MTAVKTKRKGGQKSPARKRRDQASSPPVTFTAQHRQMLNILIEEHVVTRNRQAGPPPIPFEQYAADTELLSDLCQFADGGTSDATDAAMFIYREGSREDRAQALIALLPIARRIYDGMPARR